MNDELNNKEKILPITWNFKINKDNSLIDNIHFLIRLSGIDHLEFYTNETLNKPKGHVFEIDSLTMIGEPEYINQMLSLAFDEIKKWLTEYVNSEENYKTKILDLKKSAYEIQEFLIFNTENACFLPQLPNTFTLRTNNKIEKQNERSDINVTIHELRLKQSHYEAISRHIQIRSMYFEILHKFFNLKIENLELDFIEKPKDYSVPINENEIKLLEVWIALKNLGFFDNLKSNHIELSKLRSSFFSIFNLRDWNYKQNYDKLYRTKNIKANFLLEMVHAFEAGDIKNK